eukprot:TRINITY_DN19533_c0_g1_i1.p1 TRINITY_DN19533_c0_g1~~TRINITY_DN19533_c0_g1_i1.p1  ORF type:complete len:165 (-),score=22.68 TRINITY_DN19533_c0_g1_i1:83-577(-)
MSWFFGGNTPQPAVTVVPNDLLDIKDYGGVWYEIASIKGYFQKGLSHTTCTFTAKEDGTFGIENNGRKADGSASGVKGSLAPGKAETAKMRFTVNVLGGWVNPTSDWWVVIWEKDYHVVSNPKADTCWILSRNKLMDDEVYKQILNKVSQMGVDITKIEKTPQE